MRFLSSIPFYVRLPLIVAVSLASAVGAIYFVDSLNLEGESLPFFAYAAAFSLVIVIPAAFMIGSAIASARASAEARRAYHRRAAYTAGVALAGLFVLLVNGIRVADAITAYYADQAAHMKARGDGPFILEEP